MATRVVGPTDNPLLAVSIQVARELQMKATQKPLVLVAGTLSALKIEAPKRHRGSIVVAWVDGADDCLLQVKQMQVLLEQPCQQKPQVMEQMECQHLGPSVEGPVWHG